MSCCCQKYWDLCSLPVGSGSVLKTGLNATANGIYTLCVYFLETELRFQATFSINDPIIFSIGQLNENYTYTGKILKPDGNNLTFSDGTFSYDCIQFKTILSYDLTSGGGYLGLALAGMYVKPLSGMYITVDQSEHNLAEVRGVTLISPTNDVIEASVNINSDSKQITIDSGLDLEGFKAIIY